MSSGKTTKTAESESGGRPGGVTGCVLNGKRVAMVTFSPYPGDPRPRRVVDAFVKKGMSVDLLCLAVENAPARENLNGVKIRRIPVKNRRGGKWAYLYQYAVFILISAAIFAVRSLKRRYDLVYVHNMPDILIVSALVPKLLGAKVILDMHDPMPELMTTIFDLDKNSLSVRLINRIERWSFARADLVVTVNIACKRIFSSRSCPPEKVGVVMNSPDGAIFPFCPPASPVATRSSERRFVIMYHGSLVERNGLDLAVDALAQLRKVAPGAELRIYGTPTRFLESVLRQAEKTGVLAATRYLGPKRQEELVSEIAACDIGIIPNQRNPFTEINTPTRIFEYLVLGKPVIAPRTPGIQDYFGKDALLFFEAGNADELARQLKHSFLHPAELNEIVRRGQEVCREHSWERERLRLVGFVIALLGGATVGVDQTSEPNLGEQAASVPVSQLV